MLATNVPWPRPSPGELFGSVLRLTDATRRLPKSARLSTPESTIAIAGVLACDCGSLTLPHAPSASIACTQACVDDHLPGSAGGAGAPIG